MKTIGIIPARKGSKRIYHKNMAILGGKPLLQIAIEQAKVSEVLDKIVVSTDWVQCLGLAGQMGVDSLVRPDELCQDDSHDFQFVQDTLRWYPGYDLFMILRPTSPFRTGETIMRALNRFKEFGPDSMRAVEPTKHHPSKSWDIQLHPKGELMLPFIRKSRGLIPSFDLPMQSLGRIFCQNGCIHIAQTSIIGKYSNVSGLRIMPFRTQGYEGFDINTPDDLEFANFLIEKGKVRI